MQLKLKLFCIVSLFAIIALSGCTTTTPPTTTTPTGDPIIKIIGSTGNAKELSLNDLKTLPLTSGLVDLQNQLGNWRDYGEYSGVNVSTLLNEVGGMIETDIIRITATDGYTAYYNYKNIYPSGEISLYQGKMILAYKFNDTEYPDYSDGLRIVFLAPDHHYSNADMIGSTSIESRGINPSGGARWVKNVKEIVVIREQFISIKGMVKTDTYTMTQIKLMPATQGYGQYVKSTGTLRGPYLCKGVNITYLLAEVGGLAYEFDLECKSNDGYQTTLTRNQTMGAMNTFNRTLLELGNTVENSSLGIHQVTPILIYENNNDTEFIPFRLGFIIPNATIDEAPITDGSFWLKQVVTMEMKTTTQSWTVSLKGVVNTTIDRATYESGASCSIHQTSFYRNGTTYEGLPLWIIISLFDDLSDIGPTHHIFNDTLAATNYTIILHSANGTEISLYSVNVARNSGYLLVHIANENFLDPSEAPLRLLGTAVTSELEIAQITEIRLENLP